MGWRAVSVTPSDVDMPSLVAFNASRWDLFEGVVCVTIDWLIASRELFFFFFLFSLSSHWTSRYFIKNLKYSSHFVFISNWVLLLIFFSWVFFFIILSFNIELVENWVSCYFFFWFSNLCFMTWVTDLKN